MHVEKERDLKKKKNGEKRREATNTKKCNQRELNMHTDSTKKAGEKKKYHAIRSESHGDTQGGLYYGHLIDDNQTDSRRKIPAVWSV